MMPRSERSVALNQAFLFLATARKPIADADFKALGVRSFPTNTTAWEMLFIAIRQGALPLFGTLCVSVFDFAVPGQKYYRKDGAIGTTEAPKVTTKRLVDDFPIAAGDLRNEQINLEIASIKLDACPPGAPENDLQLECHHIAVYHFDSVRVGETELHALRSKFVEEQSFAAENERLKPGPPPKYDREKLYRLCGIIAHYEGYPATLSGMVGKMQERLGDHAPSDSFLKEFLKPVYRDPEIRKIIGK